MDCKAKMQKDKQKEGSPRIVMETTREPLVVTEKTVMEPPKTLANMVSM